jgi:squalene-hopene/tetraprenyl-beta-curcumene cyclase
MPFALARPALAQQLGETAPGDVEKRLIDSLIKRVENWDKIVTKTSDNDPFVPFYGNNRRLPSLGTESVLNALVLVNHDHRWAKGALSAASKKALGHLWQQQKEDGSWLWLDFGLRPWETDAVYFGASLAAVAVGTAGKSYYDQDDVRPKVAALRMYLRTQFASQPLHHRVVALWASSRLPDVLTAEDKKRVSDDLWTIQEPDGGWSAAKLGRRTSGNNAWKAHAVYPEGIVSDGYATGLAVLALKRAGTPAGDARLKKAVGWLVSRQQEGTWPASYLNKTRDPQENVGKFMRDSATAFAILALTESD